MESKDSTKTETQDWPDPWPLKGMTNAEWARMLMAYLFASDIVPPSLESRVQYLTRALDIACMYSQPPGQKIRLRLCDLLEEAMNELEGIGSADFAYIASVRSEVENARRFKGR